MQFKVDLLLGIFVKGLRKTTNYFGQDCLCPRQDSNQSPSKYKQEALSVELAC
jgi:hypothetical protein